MTAAGPSAPTDAATAAPGPDGLRDRRRRAANLALSLAQFVAAAFAINLGGLAAFGELAGAPPIVPANYAFGVWCYLYVASAAYGAFQALPAQRERELLRRVGPFTAATFAATALWTVALALRWYWLTAPTMFVLLGASAGAFARLVRHRAPLSRLERHLVSGPVGAFAGWLTLATLANAATVLRRYGLEGAGVWGPVGSSIALAFVGLVGALVKAASRGHAGYALALGWGLVGVIVANLRGERGEESIEVVAVAGAMLAAVAAACAWGRVRARRRGRPVTFADTTRR